jgi:hypothetical protein
MKLSTILEAKHHFDDIKDSFHWKNTDEEIVKELKSISGVTISKEQTVQGNMGSHYNYHEFVFSYRGEEMIMHIHYFSSIDLLDTSLEWNRKTHFLYDLHDDPKSLSSYHHKSNIPPDSHKDGEELDRFNTINGFIISDFHKFSEIAGSIKELYKKIEKWRLKHEAK